MIIFNMKLFIFINVIVVSIIKFMIMLSSILFFLNIIFYDCVYGIYGGVYGMSSLFLNL